MDMEHKLLNYLEHLWPYLSGFALTLMAGFKLWWSDKRALDKRIANNEILVEHIREHMATKVDLNACKDEVDEQDRNNMALVLQEIQVVRLENKSEHKEITDTMHDQQTEILNQIIDLIKDRNGNNN